MNKRVIKKIQWSKIFVPLKSFFRVIGIFIHRFYQEWGKDNVFFSSAAISFNVLITLIPVTLLIFQLSALVVVGNISIREEFITWLTELNPFVPQSVLAELDIAVFSKSSAFSIIGFVTLLWMVSRLFGTIRTALDKVFGAPGRNIVLGKLYDFFLATLVALCFVLAIVFAISAKIAASSLVGEYLTTLPVVGTFLNGFLAKLLSFTFTFLIFFLLYWAGPNKSISKKLSFFTAILALVMTGIGTEIYMWAISAPDWGVVYGSFISIMATLIWLYWLCVIFVGSAEATTVIAKMRSTSVRKHKNTIQKT